MATKKAETVTKSADTAAEKTETVTGQGKYVFTKDGVTIHRPKSSAAALVAAGWVQK